MNGLSLSIIICNSFVCMRCIQGGYELQFLNTLNLSQWMIRLDALSGLHCSMINYLYKMMYLIH